MFEPEFFHQVSQEVLSQLQIYFSKVDGMGARPFVTPLQMKETALKFLDSSGTRDKNSVAIEMSETFLKYAYKLHSPKSLGHQVVPSMPATSAFELLASATNSSCGVFEMGPLVNGIERALVEKLNAYIGWGKTSDGIVTSGGSLANLTALLAARNLKLKDSWKKGAPAGMKIVTGKDTHYSVSRGAGIIGTGTDNILKAELDENRKVDPEKLRGLVRKNRESLFAIVGSACATPIGAFDSLDDLAEIAREFGLWFHVDGAHGASLLLSKKYGGVLKGINQADSVTWDAHKMMFVPSLCTFLLFRNKEDSFKIFEQDAPYLLSTDDPLEGEFDSARRTVECTKRSLSIGTWALWSLYGPGFIASLIEKTIDTTKEFYQLLQSQEDFKVLHKPECNILCFRYEPLKTKGWPPLKISEFQLATRKKILKSGEFYITGTVLDGVYSLRVTIMNPKTGVDHLNSLLQHIREVAP